MAINDHHLAYDAEETHPGEWRHQHPHDHPQSPELHRQSYYGDDHPHYHWRDKPGYHRTPEDHHHPADTHDPDRHDPDPAP